VVVAHDRRRRSFRRRRISGGSPLAHHISHRSFPRAAAGFSADSPSRRLWNSRRVERVCGVRGGRRDGAAARRALDGRPSARRRSMDRLSADRLVRSPVAASTHLTPSKRHSRHLATYLCDQKRAASRSPRFGGCAFAHDDHVQHDGHAPRPAHRAAGDRDPADDAHARARLAANQTHPRRRDLSWHCLGHPRARAGFFAHNLDLLVRAARRARALRNVRESQPFRPIHEPFHRRHDRAAADRSDVADAMALADRDRDRAWNRAGLGDDRAFPHARRCHRGNDCRSIRRPHTPHFQPSRTKSSRA